jgi:hypothetical protein
MRTSTEQELTSTVSSLHARLSSLTQLYSTLQLTNAQLLTQRKQLHNTVQHLRGNIRVLCRVRPLLLPHNATNANANAAAAAAAAQQQQVVVAADAKGGLVWLNNAKANK